MASATITTKGQITIPKSIRDSLMLNTGDQIEFIVTDKKERRLSDQYQKKSMMFSAY